MKKTLILIVSLLVAGVVWGQNTWPMPGAQWTYELRYCEPPGAGDLFAIETWGVTGDSVIDGNIYNVIQPTDYSGEEPPEQLYHYYDKILLTRFSNDTVYRYVNNREYIFFIFNLEEGDAFTTFRSAGWRNHGNDSTCSSIKPLRVNKISELQPIPSLKVYQLEDTIFGELNTIPGDKKFWFMCDRIGFLYTYPLIDTREIAPGYVQNELYCVFSFSPITAETLVSYIDDEINYSFYGLSENQSEIINISPNPTTDKVCLNFTKEEYIINQVEVCNMVGMTVLKTNRLQDNILDVESLPSGVYVLCITTNEGRQMFTKLVKR